jgi:hypothetical protein
MDIRIVAPFLGDCVLAYFGYPEAHENDAERSVRAGLALADAVARLIIRLAPSLHVALLRGSSWWAAPALTVPSLHPSRSARPRTLQQLQSRASPDTVLVATSTRDLVRGFFDYREVGRLTLEGLAESAPMWQVVGLSAAESRFEALRGEGVTPLIGRDEEIDLLLRRWQQIQSGEGRVVLISWEPGIGKSRLVRASGISWPIIRF